MNTRKKIRASYVLVALLLLCPGAVASQSFSAKKPVAKPERLVAVRIYPQDVSLWGPQSTQRFLVLAKYANGLERDVTSSARFSLSGDSKGDMDASGKFTPKKSGEAVLTAQFGGQTAKTSIRIESGHAEGRVTFAREISGIFSKRGCNSSSCHAGVKGRGGFKLSIDGVFPEDDYKWIVEGGTYHVLTAESGEKIPRINLKDPEKSLLLLKPTFEVPHGGGLRFEAGSPDYQTILDWIRAGAPYEEKENGKSVTVERVEVFPKEVVLNSSGKQQLLVTAFLSNGRRQDITESVLYVTNDSMVAEVSESGLVQAHKTGETAVLVHSPGYVVNSKVGVIEKPVTNFTKVEERNYIDQHVFAKLRKFHIIPSELSTDREFLRRVCLDLTGTLPPPERVREFVADKSPDKRDRVIENLLASPEYVDYWAFRLGDVMRANFGASNRNYMADSYQRWVTNSVAANKPYDVMARQRIASQGFSSTARNFYLTQDLQPSEILMPELVRLFFGRRIECAQCHNHPFETWSQDQFWGLAAFFGGLKELVDSKVVIDVLGGGHVDQPREMVTLHPRTKAKVVPAFLDSTKLPPNRWMDPRMRLAEWMTAHPYFAESTVDRFWSYFLGRGIVDPVDDFRSSNPPTNPELLKALAADFKDSGYDLKRLFRTIVQSRTYQLSWVTNETNKNDRINYSHASLRVLEAAVMLDAITSVTGVHEKFTFHPFAGGGDAPPGSRAMQMMPDICASLFMDAFGRSNRRSLPAGAPQPTLLGAMDMIAGDVYTNKIVAEGGRLERLLKEGASDEKILDEFYLAALSRAPTPQEKTEILGFLGERAARRKGALADAIWAIISSREFAYNH